MADTPSIGYLLKQTQLLLHARMEEALHPYALTVSHYSCLFRLRVQPGISASDLARATFVTRQSMNTMLQTLLDRGLIARAAHAETGRALPVSLTAAGARLLATVQPIVDEIELRMLSPLSPTRVAALGASLAACGAALESLAEVTTAS
jgi:DNA-binding MarR family transcriptional regulator